MRRSAIVFHHFEVRATGSERGSDYVYSGVRYMYFPSSRRQFGLSGPSLLEVGHDERESDGMLASALGV